MTDQIFCKISDIKPEMRNLTITGRITQVGDAKTVTTKYGPAQVAPATLEDDSGSIRLNLWREQINMVRVGDSVKLENAFVRRFNQQNELNIGKDGKINIINKS